MSTYLHPRYPIVVNSSFQLDLFPSYNRIWDIHFQEHIFEHPCLDSIRNTYTFSPTWKQSRSILGNFYNTLSILKYLTFALLQEKKLDCVFLITVTLCLWIFYSLIFISIIIGVNRKLHLFNKYWILLKAWVFQLKLQSLFRYSSLAPLKRYKVSIVETKIL